MEPFVPKFRGRPWESGMGALHVYVLPRPGVDAELLRLVQACRPILAGYPIDPQYGSGPSDAGLLHLTGEMLADVPSADYDEAAREEIVAALHAELADMPPFMTQVGPPIGNASGAVLDVWPEEDVGAVIERVRGAIRATRGEDALQHSGGRPHISLGYSHARASSDPLNGELRNAVLPRRATLAVDRVHLLDVTWAFDDGLGGWRMAWDPVAEIPLRGRLPE
ncbi:2'-5' RNA ligase family protein [Streptomyces sp. NPDC087440]|uniref:2'-5' RNA ligase family protein n=1 Tax=Streptomyces sp. NPDC087440 TaxID=3365790 RepID=UPI0038212440